MPECLTLSAVERDALKRDFFSSLHCALPGKILSFDAETQTAEIQPTVPAGASVLPLTAPPAFGSAVALGTSPE